MLSADVLYSTVRELGRDLRAKKFTSVQLTAAYLDRLSRLGPQLNAVVTVTSDLALEQARQADQELAAGHPCGPLHGIPYGAKDLLATKGIKTTWGCRAYAQQVPGDDATIIKRLREAGAVLVAKLAMVELAGGAGYRYASASLTGPGLNPWNTGRWAGGSSSGSGAAVAAGLVGFAIGSDTWGSIVTPAGLCGVSGLRPTYGRASRHGAMALSWSMDKLGPLARSVEDCALVLAAISGLDPADPTSAGEPFVAPTRASKPSLRGREIGFIREDFAQFGEPEVEQAYNQALDTLRSLGAKLEQVKLPEFPYDAVAGTIVAAEAAAAFEELIRAGHTEEIVDPEGRVGLYAARLISAADYLKCLRIRALIQNALANLFGQSEVLVAPSLLIVAPPIEANLDEVFKGGGEIEAAGNLAGLPALSVPCGFGRDHLPAGLQIVGKAFDEKTVLEVGRAFQAATSWHRERPPLKG
jgi:aspartyl-tRNA(Asn)/glutamyl-tRNA(Gln) amidotransferase subunit A